VSTVTLLKANDWMFLHPLLSSSLTSLTTSIWNDTTGRKETTHIFLFLSFPFPLTPFFLCLLPFLHSQLNSFALQIQSLTLQNELRELMVP
jgi:hypothetical protein